MPRPAVKFITTPEQWKAISTPVRAEIVEAMRDLAPCPIRDVAKFLQVSPDRLYRHVDVLVDAGFLVRTELRKVGRHAEQVFDLTADDFHLAMDGVAPARGAELLRDTAHLFLKRTGRAIDRAADARAFDLTTAGRNVALVCDYTWLSREQFQQLRELIRAAKQYADDARPKRQGQMYLTLFCATPVPPPARRGRAGKNAAARASSTRGTGNDAEGGATHAPGDGPSRTPRRGTKSRPARGG
jgi:predicted ArsR family transcriptional regulator